MSPVTTTELQPEQERAQATAETRIAICLGPGYDDGSSERLSRLLDLVRATLGDRVAETIVAFPSAGGDAGAWRQDGLLLQPYAQSHANAQEHPLLLQTAANYLSLFEVMRAHGSACGVLLGPEAHTLEPGAIRALLSAVLDRNLDLALPRYQVAQNESLVNAAILHPLAQSMFGGRVAFPLAQDLAVSFRMAERLAASAQRNTANNQPGNLLWPTAEAAVAGFSIGECGAGRRELSQPDDVDLSSILSTVAASLFAEVDAKASYWQRTRPAIPTVNLEGVPPQPAVASPVDPAEISELVENFRIGYGNLHELWSLVLPPQTLLGLKRLSRLDADSFNFADALWVRIVYDFALAFRLRTINRGHLLGSLSPLYLAWVASHLQASRNGAVTGNPPEALARAFEADKPYLVSRWRWPDRFNP